MTIVRTVASLVVEYADPIDVETLVKPSDTTVTSDLGVVTMTRVVIDIVMVLPPIVVRIVLPPDM